jgi:hypothetical protein
MSSFKQMADPYLRNYNFNENILGPLKIVGFEEKRFHEFMTDLFTSPSILLDSRIVTKILKYKFEKSEQVLLRKSKRSAAVKFAFIVLLLVHMILREEDPVEDKWENDFYATVYPVLKRSTKANIDLASKEEINFLIAFYRAMMYLTQIMPARQNKNLFIKVAAKLEGSNATYVTGGKNSVHTQRRVEIFELITNVKPRDRDNTKPRKTAQKAKKTRSTSFASFSTSFHATQTIDSYSLPSTSSDDCDSDESLSDDEMQFLQTIEGDDEMQRLQKIDDDFELDEFLDAFDPLVPV